VATEHDGEGWEWVSPDKNVDLHVQRPIVHIIRCEDESGTNLQGLQKSLVPSGIQECPAPLLT